MSQLHLLQPADLLLQLTLPGAAVILLQTHAAAAAPPLLGLQLEELQVLQLLAQVFNELWEPRAGGVSESRVSEPLHQAEGPFWGRMAMPHFPDITTRPAPLPSLAVKSHSALQMGPGMLGAG